jgi:hypothetical protein
MARNQISLGENRMISSQKAISFMIAQEDGDQAYYAKTEQGWDWPEGMSGPTCGVGFDCGYETQTSIRAAWEGIVNDDMLHSMQAAAGLKGQAAHQFVMSHRHEIDIPYAIAVKQFMQRELPRWEDITAEALPNFRRLSGDCAGALVSLTYNRGPEGYHSTLPRFREMLGIKIAMEDWRIGLIPELISGMVRLWPNSRDLIERRVGESRLFAGGISSCLAQQASTSGSAPSSSSPPPLPTEPSSSPT